jgi:hypothetical protein
MSVCSLFRKQEHRLAPPSVSSVDVALAVSVFDEVHVHVPSLGLN